MKKIIRLNENDLARIVRRVIKEQSTPTPKVETLNPPLQVKVLDSQENRIANLTIKTISLGNRGIKFTGNDAFNKPRNGTYICDKGTVIFNGPTNNGIHFSKDGVAKFQTYCDRFASNGNKTDLDIA